MVSNARAAVVDFLDGMVGDSPDDVGQIGLGIDAVHLAGLCRAPNYAERARFSLEAMVTWL
jgi:hypothetical protein